MMSQSYDRRNQLRHPLASVRRRRALEILAGGLVSGSFLAPEDADAARFGTVILDAGHGGKDNGAKWGGVPEKSLTLDVAKRVDQLLKKKGVSTVMTRTYDKYISIDDRVARANRYGNSIVVSIHFNAHTNRSVKGIETFYMSSRGRTLASLVQRRLVGKIRTRDRGVKKTSRYGILRKTKATAILVECGFISNSWERGRCKTTWYRQLVAQAIADGILAYRGSSYASNASADLSGRA